MIKRRKTRTVKIGSLKIGTKYPISIQSMSKTDTQDVSATVRQIKALEQAGCEIIRLAVKNMNSIFALKKIKARINIPVVADIHFNYRLGLEAIACGVDALRLNPGNIYRREEVEEIARAARKKRIPIRVGVNSGSLAKKPVTSNQKPENMPDLMVRSALDYIKLLESFDFYDIIVSLKASDVVATVEAYRKLARLCDYPFHLGITASGLKDAGVIKSAIGIGSLLLEGIGDTMRVSLTAPAQEEVRVAKEILQALGLCYFGPEIVACPTCGRCQVDLVKIAQKISRELSAIRHPPSANRPPKVAVMGCEVNGPGEAGDADLGIAAGKRCGLLFKKGKVVKRVKESQIVETLVRELVKRCSGQKV